MNISLFNLHKEILNKENTLSKEKKEIDQKEVVLDDIVLLKNGNQIYADCVVIDGSAEVNESMITGESLPLKKNSKLGGYFIFILVL